MQVRQTGHQLLQRHQGRQAPALQLWVFHVLKRDRASLCNLGPLLPPHHPPSSGSPPARRPGRVPGQCSGTGVPARYKSSGAHWGACLIPAAAGPPSGPGQSIPGAAASQPLPAPPAGPWGVQRRKTKEKVPSCTHLWEPLKDWPPEGLAQSAMRVTCPAQLLVTYSPENERPACPTAQDVFGVEGYLAHHGKLLS